MIVVKAKYNINLINAPQKTLEISIGNCKIKINIKEKTKWTILFYKFI